MKGIMIIMIVVMKMILQKIHLTEVTIVAQLHFNQTRRITNMMTVLVTQLVIMAIIQ